MPNSHKNDILEEKNILGLEIEKITISRNAPILGFRSENWPAKGKGRKVKSVENLLRNPKIGAFWEIAIFSSPKEFFSSSMSFL